MEKKGIEVEYMFLIGGLVLVLLFVSYWQQMGLSLAAKNWGELKVQTITHVKNVILLMQTAPVETETCVPVTGCDKIAVHQGYVEIWGAENEYFKEPSYLSTALSTGMLDIYMKNEQSKTEIDKLVALKECEGTTDPGNWGGCGFITPCGTGNSIVFICFKKQYVQVDASKIIPGEVLYVEYPDKSGIYRNVQEANTERISQGITSNLQGTHKIGLAITRQTDLSK
jgi:hypothetical protein